MIGCALYPHGAVAVDGTPVACESSPGTVRAFCGRCGTGLFYTNEAVSPGMIDVQSATFDAPNNLPAQGRIQLANAPTWLTDYAAPPRFARFPGLPA